MRRGIVSIASPNRDAVYAAEQAVRSIVSPPMVEVGATYKGRVVNITKFGAFVNILPGRDGLVHISKLGGGRRVERVEDVLDLGDEIEVVVEDIDHNSKVSLTPVGALAAAEGGGGEGGGGGGRGDVEYVSFEDAFDDELRTELGDLGPAGRGVDRGGDRGDRGGDRGGGRDRGGRGGGSRGGGGRDRGGRGGGRR